MAIFFYLLISTTLSVALGESDICSTHPSETCRFNDLMPKDLPDTVKDLKEGCNDLQELVRCFINYMETCQEDVMNTPNFRAFLNFIRENCQEDSHLYQVISRNLDCFTPTIKSLEKECAEGFIEETLMENLMEEAGDLFEDHGSYRCLSALWMITCKTQLMEKRCGSEIGDALLNILQNMDYDFTHYCKTELLSNFSLFIEAIEMTISEGKWLEELNNDED